MVVYDSLMQFAIPDAVKGRVFTLMEILSIGTAGILADTLGIQAVYYFGGALLIGAGLSGVVLLGGYRFNPARDLGIR